MSNKILIVDDSRAWLIFHKNLIKELYGDIFEITTAQSALEALNIIKSDRLNPYNLIITDLQMELNFEPMSAGEWLIENIKTIREYSYSQIIIISSMYNIEETAKKYKVNCISKMRLTHNKLLLKYMFEKLMPFLGKI